MLRITRMEKEGTIWLKLDGKLIGPWVEEVRCASAKERLSGLALALDMGEVTYVDSAGTQLLWDFVREGVAVPIRSNFVAELLRLERG